MPMTSDIQNFVAKVRHALADLDTAVVNELTDGLEADLHERAAEEGDGFKLGKPSAYAAELRASAGLGQSRPPGSRLGKSLFGLARAVAGQLSRLTPIWWFLRGTIVGLAIAWLWTGQLSLVFESRRGFLVLMLSILASLSLGLWARKNWLTRVVSAIATVAVAGIGLFGTSLVLYKISEYKHLKGLSEAKVLTWAGDYTGEVQAFDKNGRRLPLELLKERYRGVTIYRQSDFGYDDAKPAASLMLGTVGHSVQEALGFLSERGYNSVDFVYVSNAQPKGTVVGVQQLSTNQGYVIKLKISQGK